MGRARSRHDPELEAGARAHFEDPLYYEQAYAPRTEDARYYERLAEGVPALLEHGVGSGRIALPIARAGTKVVGIDHSTEMLAHLRGRLEAEPAAVRKRIALHHGDIRTARLGRRFPLLIAPFNVTLHLYTREDVEAWLARVREHLTPRGTLVFDVSMPMLEDLARDPAVGYTVPAFVHPTAGRVRYREHFDYDRVRQILFVSMFFTPSRRGGEEFMTPLAHRQFYPREMEALLHYNGFEVVALHGDYAGGPLVQRSDVMIWHARPRARRRSA